ncbi:MAG: MBL fold metallo-hydrolase [Candidatus Zixiibacteriota bacterium]
MIQLGFHGAAGTVTGSKYLLTVDKRKILVDCGMFQGAKELRERNWAPPPFDPAEIEAVVLTHGHVDHIGYLPRLVRQGFKGKIYATIPTCDIVAITLRDTANLQMEDADYRNRKRLTHHPVALPLFTEDDAEETIRHLAPLPFNVWTRIGEEIRFRYHVVGHILGAASVEIEMNDGSREVSILFSGDIGRYGNPVTRNPAEPPSCDYLVCESTYGGRVHPAEDPHTEFASLIKEIQSCGGVLVIPAFAIGRTQQITYLVNDLIQHNWIRPIEVHIDSPMAISATDIYVKYASYHSLDVQQAGGIEAVLEGPRVHRHRKRTASKKLNRLRGPAIIISASGMCAGGRIMHHLLNRLGDPKNIVALVGFMAEGTVGRKLADGDKLVYIHKTPVEVRAKTARLGGLSGHADYFEIMHWLEPMKPPKRVFLTHGEPTQSQAMADHLKQERGWPTHIPELGETVEL